MAIPFVEARWYTTTSGRTVDVVVIHAMQAGETSTTAEAVARMFATTSTKKSAHYSSEDNSTVQSVREKDVAYAAPGNNHNGIQLELAGFSEQTAKQWADAFSSKMLREQAAPLVADVCTRHRIPVRFLDAAALLRKERGITTHKEVSKAWKKSTHWDPGPNFPMGSFLTIVRAHMDGDEDVSYSKWPEKDKNELASDLLVKFLPTIEAAARRTAHYLATGKPNQWFSPTRSATNYGWMKDPATITLPEVMAAIKGLQEPAKAEALRTLADL